MAAPPVKIDRQTTTPFLLRLFYKQSSFHRLDEFAPDARLPQHLQIYTWQSCTLSELTHLLLLALPQLLQRPYAGTRVAFRMVFADLNGSRQGTARYISKELGSVVIGEGRQDEDEQMNGGESTAGGVKEALKRLDGEPDKTLQEGKFVIGDYICCAILPPLADGSVASAPPPPTGLMARGPPRGGRENGFGGRGGGGDYGHGGRGGGRGGRPPYEDRRPSSSLPAGEWRRGEAPPPSTGDRDRGEGGYWRGGAPGGGGRGRGRGRW
ncbi:Sin3 associated polypeptide p18-domain-containing protein [Lophiotrema nucula]|uniref:Sin3 associated polypeptide p18-domain-containing protein n=1 Tax=Lophiotrema nucula TaxID=690887 RepID=A0A6A5ZKW6_9PLEO|nr:Sin3 associated polypeptide p18-domain-containing protein [Lophiotrema nucula]